MSRYFEVKVITTVTSCQDCLHSPMNNHKYFGCGLASIGTSVDVFKQNHNQLTDSCPMWNETKESETK